MKAEEVQMNQMKSRSFNKATSAGFIVALGIIYGDIGTSPLYTMQSILESQEELSILKKHQSLVLSH